MARIYLSKQDNLARKIGCRLIFHRIPFGYIPAIARCEMTRTWKDAGLDIERGQNHFTFGEVVKGRSSRFDPKSPRYQSWFGGYTVKTDSDKKWGVKDYCKLAIADQNSWLHWYGDPHPSTTVENWEYMELGAITIKGGRVGKLYQGGFGSHSDVGPNLNTVRFYFASHGLASLFNLTNQKLVLSHKTFRPMNLGFPYHEINGRVYLAIFDIQPRVKVAIYANGIIGKSNPTDTFELLKGDFKECIRSCEIVEAL